MNLRFNMSAVNAINKMALPPMADDSEDLDLADWDVAQAYIKRGWSAPMPLPSGEKLPPPGGMTGNVPFATLEKVKGLWKGKEGKNLGLRLQPPVLGDEEIISIDVDHYGTKTGDIYLREMEAQLGSLNRDSSWRSTRRGPENPSGQTFFRVPAGLTWSGKVCADVDVVHMTHRYSVVWPSVKDNSQYRWIDPDGRITTEIPDVSELPRLPEAWIKALTSGKRSAATRPEAKSFTGNGSSQFREAIGWLRGNLSGWTSSEEEDVRWMTPSLEKVSSSERFESDLAHNGHDTMVSAVHSAIRLGTEGHSGVKSALERIGMSFVKAVTSGNRRSKKDATAEYQRAVVGEVERVKAEVEAGTLYILREDPSLAIPNLADLVVTAEAERKPQGITNFWDYGDNDFDNARIYASYWGTDVLVSPNAPTEQRFARWSNKSGRYTFSSASEMYTTVAIGLSKRIEYEADQVEAEALLLKEKAAQGQITAEEDDRIEELESVAKNLHKRADRLLNTTAMKHVLEQLGSVDEIKVLNEEFNSVDGVLGIAGGKTLEVNSPDLTVRESVKGDLLTMSTKAFYQEGATHKNWNKFLEDFLPSKDLQRFVQKVMGYTLIDGNPEKIIVFLYGPNHTGKTTILEAIGAALGDYASPMNAVKLLGRNTGGPNSEVLSNISKRMVFMSEIGNDYKLSANIVKQVTGNDSQQLRGVHSPVVIAKTPSFTPYVATNTIPEIEGGDEALKNRLVVIPFKKTNKFSVTKEESIFDPSVFPAILWWLLEGVRMYKEEGLERATWPQSVLDTVEEFTGEISPVHEFVARHLAKTDDPKRGVLRDDVDALWKKFAMEEGIPRKEWDDLKAFHTAIKNLGFQPSRTTVKGKANQNIYRGVQIIK